MAARERAAGRGRGSAGRGKAVRASAGRDAAGGAAPTLLDLDEGGLKSVLESAGEPSFRARQIREWVFGRHVLDYRAMTNLPRGLWEKLSALLPADPFEQGVIRSAAADGTEKIVLTARDGERVEAVVIPSDQRVALCISTQAGCALGCITCATGMGGFRRNLSRAEILGQAVRAAAFSGRRVGNIVLMGMGEPLLNYANVMSAVREMASDRGMAIGTRRITLSTVGVVPGILRMCREDLHPNLAVSLHAAEQRRRARIAPSARKWELDEIIDAAGLYAEVCGRPVTYEYILIEGINSSQSDADRLGKLLRRRPAKVNLIPLNPVPRSNLRPPDAESVRRFKLKVEAYGVITTLRAGRGAEIQAACGQLAGGRGPR